MSTIARLALDRGAPPWLFGSALLATATDWIRSQGRIPVLDVVASHDGIVDLYRRRGWREVGIAHPPWLPESPLTLMVLDDR